MLIHQVFFWLDDPKKDLNEVLEGCKSLAAIQTAIKTEVGTPAVTPARPVVDGTYHIALQVSFKNVEDHNHYQTDPIHLKFIKEHKSKWNRVQIYDFDV